MGNFIITENYNPNRKVKYIWQIKPEHNDIKKIKRLFAKHDAEDPSLYSDEVWVWDLERKCFSTEDGCFEYQHHFGYDYVGLKDEYKEMKENDTDTFDDIIGNQFAQYRNMMRFAEDGNNLIDVCRGIIKSDGSHAQYGVELFDEDVFLEPFVK